MRKLFSPTLLFMLLLVSPVSAVLSIGWQSEPWTNWQTSLHADHALVGKIWSVGEKRFMTPLQLGRELEGADYLLLGEVHDNPDHHRLQAWLIGQIAKRQQPQVVMEMISRDKAELLDTYLATPDANATGLGPALGWAKSGWPKWPNYQPIAEAAFQAGLTIVAGDAKRAAIRAVGKKGLASIDAAEQKRLALDRPLSASLDEALIEDIKQSHCNLLPKKAVAPMTGVQRFRDAALANALVMAGRKGPVVLIAGNGHVRNDRGVPWYLTRQTAGAKIKSVMLLEVLDEVKTILDLSMDNPDGNPATDYIWVTPQKKREDQCEKLKQMFKKK